MPTVRKPARRFRERAELLDFLLELVSVTAETLDLDQMLAAVAQYVHRVVPHELFAILLYSERTRTLRIRHARGHREELVRNLAVHLGEGITGAAAESRKAVVVNDVRGDVRYLNSLDAVRSELAVPMVSRSKLVGVIDIQATRVNAFSPDEVALLRVIAGRVASSIENARLHRRVERSNRTRNVLARLAQEFSSILDLDELLTRIAQSVRPLIQYDAFSVLLLDEGQSVLRHQVSVRYDERASAQAIPLDKGITGAAATSREVLRVGDIKRDPRYIATHPGVLSEIAVPLVLRDRVIGVMDLESERINHFTEEHERLLTLLAPTIASAVENARLYAELAQKEQRMEQDLAAARKLQSVLLPRSAPPARGLEIALGVRPAREVSGDLYDFFEYASGSFVIAFGDVSGKGAAAALYGALVSGLLRTLAPRERGPAELMRTVNEVLLERKVDATYVTLTVLLWEERSGRLTMANAGGTPPLICRDGKRVELTLEGVPLGLLPDQQYEEVTLETRRGDVVVLFSDGVQDQQDPADREFGTGGLFDVVKEHCGNPPQAIVEAVFDSLDAHRAGVAVQDDQSLIVLKVLSGCGDGRPEEDACRTRTATN